MEAFFPPALTARPRIAEALAFKEGTCGAGVSWLHSSCIGKSPLDGCPVNPPKIAAMPDQSAAEIKLLYETFSAPSGHRRAALHAVLFLLICLPVWLAPQWVTVPHPIFLVAALIALTFLFLRREKRSLAVLGLNASWLRFGELLAGIVGGVLLMMTVALCVGALLPFPWARNPLFSPSAAGLSLVGFLCGNAVEELIFRGYSFERLIVSI